MSKKSKSAARKKRNARRKKAAAQQSAAQARKAFGTLDVSAVPVPTPKPTVVPAVPEEQQIGLIRDDSERTGNNKQILVRQIMSSSPLFTVQMREEPNKLGFESVHIVVAEFCEGSEGEGKQAIMPCNGFKSIAGNFFDTLQAANSRRWTIENVYGLTVLIAEPHKEGKWPLSELMDWVLQHVELLTFKPYEQRSTTGTDWLIEEGQHYGKYSRGDNNRGRRPQQPKRDKPAPKPKVDGLPPAESDIAHLEPFQLGPVQRRIVVLPYVYERSADPEGRFDVRDAIEGARQNHDALLVMQAVNFDGTVTNDVSLVLKTNSGTPGKLLERLNKGDRGGDWVRGTVKGGHAVLEADGTLLSAREILGYFYAVLTESDQNQGRRQSRDKGKGGGRGNGNGRRGGRRQQARRR